MRTVAADPSPSRESLPEFGVAYPLALLLRQPVLLQRQRLPVGGFGAGGSRLARVCASPT
jgi:hypothetical protein